MAVSESSARRYALDPDVRLMLEVRDGSATAFEELVVRYQARLVRILEHMVGRRELAEDLAQEVFLRVYRSRRKYEPWAKFATWLFTIANNVASSALRDGSRRPEVTLNGSESGPLGARPMDWLIQASSSAMPTRQIDKAELRDVVRMAMESLGPRQRLAVLLNKFEGMSYADIANAMELSQQSIKSLLSRARENLRQLLEPYFEEGALPRKNNKISDSVAASNGLATDRKE
ncbi:MAG: sigma-70 family RNA polymerase sigma factor [Planctomycetota bacterium]